MIDEDDVNPEEHNEVENQNYPPEHQQHLPHEAWHEIPSRPSRRPRLTQDDEEEENG